VPVGQLVAAAVGGLVGVICLPALRRVDRAYPSPGAPGGPGPAGDGPAVARWLPVASPFVAASLGARLGLVAVLPAALLFAVIGIALSRIDIRCRRLPDRLTLPSYPALAVLLLAAAVARGDYWPLAHAVLAAVLAGLAYATLSVVSGGTGIGLGDAKLVGLVGLLLGWWGVATVLYGLLLAQLSAGIFALALVLVGRAGRRSTIPLGPFLVGGTVLALLVVG